MLAPPGSPPGLPFLYQLLSPPQHLPQLKLYVPRTIYLLVTWLTLQNEGAGEGYSGSKLGRSGSWCGSPLEPQGQPDCLARGGCSSNTHYMNLGLSERRKETAPDQASASSKGVNKSGIGEGDGQR